MTIETYDDSHEASTSPGAPAAPRRRDLPRAVWALATARTVNRLGAFTLAFLAVVLVQRFGASLADAGRLMALFGLATVPSRLLGGRLADRLGAVPTIVLGLSGCAVAQLGIATSSSLTAAGCWVVVLGLAFELYEPPSQALVADLTDEDHRPVAYGLLGVALAAAGAVAGLLAAWLGGLDLRLLLLADAATCLLAAVLVVTLVRPAAPRRRPATTPEPIGDSGPWRDRRLLAMFGSGTVFATVYLALVTTLPLTLAARGVPAERAGLVLTVSAATVVIAQPLLRARLLRNGFAAMTTGYVVLALGLLATAFATTLPAFLAAAVVWSLGDLLLLAHPCSIVSTLAPPGSRGRYLATYGLSWGVAATVAPLLGTALLARGGPVLLWATLAGASLVLAATQPALARCVRRAGPSRRSGATGRAARGRRARRAAGA